VLFSAGPAEAHAVREVLVERLGMAPEVLADLRLLCTSKVVWAIRKGDALEEALDVFRAERTGLPLIRRVGKHWKPTTAALQAFGAHLTRGIASLSAAELERLVTEGSLRGTREELDEGYVAIRGPDGIIGCGLYLDPMPEEEKKEGLLRSQLPKAQWEPFGRHLREQT
jgi:hypothetical protein